MYISKILHQLKDHNGPVLSLCYSTTGQYLLSGGQDRKVNLWNPNTGLLINTYEGHSKGVFDICVSYDNSKFSTCGGEKTIYIWDVISNNITRKIFGHSNSINAVSFNSNASVLASGSSDATVKLWDMKSFSNKPLQILNEAKDSVSCVKIANNDIITTSIDGYVRTYDVRMGKLISDRIGYHITSISLSRDFEFLLISTLNNKLSLCDRADGNILNTFTGHKNETYQIKSTFADNDSKVISGSEDGNLYIWDIVTSELLSRLSVNDGLTENSTKSNNLTKSNAITAVVCNPEQSPQVVSCDENGSIYVWT